MSFDVMCLFRDVPPELNHFPFLVFRFACVQEEPDKSIGLTVAISVFADLSSEIDYECVPGDWMNERAFFSIIHRCPCLFILNRR